MVGWPEAGISHRSSDDRGFDIIHRDCLVTCVCVVAGVSGCPGYCCQSDRVRRVERLAIASYSLNGNGRTVVYCRCSTRINNRRTQSRVIAHSDITWACDNWIFSVVDCHLEATGWSCLGRAINLSRPHRKQRSGRRRARHSSTADVIRIVIDHSAAHARVIRDYDVRGTIDSAVGLDSKEYWVVIGHGASKRNAVASEHAKESRAYSFYLLVVTQHALPASAAIGCRGQEVLKNYVRRERRALIDAHSKVNREHRDHTHWR